MKRIACLALCVALGGCATTMPPPQTVTITKTVPVYPPSSLYDDGPDCQHGTPQRKRTVQDLAEALAIERGSVDRCRADRAALRQWVQDNGDQHK
jgi:hypothetical protein